MPKYRVAVFDDAAKDLLSREVEADNPHEAIKRAAEMPMTGYGSGSFGKGPYGEKPPT